MDNTVLRDSYKTEVIEGVTHMYPMPHIKHSEVCMNIYDCIFSQLIKSTARGYMGCLPYYYNIEDEESYVVPDLAIIDDSDKIVCDRYVGSPLLVVEVLSPYTVDVDKEIKKRIYERAGVQEYWIVDYREKEVTIYYLIDGKLKQYDEIPCSKHNCIELRCLNVLVESTVIFNCI